MFLGHDPFLDDITASLLKDYCAWCKDRGLSERTIADYRGYIARIVRHALPGSLTSYEKDPPKLLRNSLLAYIEKEYLGQHGVEEPTAKYRRSAVRKLSEFIGRDVT